VNEKSHWIAVAKKVLIRLLASKKFLKNKKIKLKGGYF
jgi:hypothetical protein